MLVNDDEDMNNDLSNSVDSETEFGLLSDEDIDGSEAVCSDDEGSAPAALEGLNSGTLHGNPRDSSLSAPSLEETLNISGNK